MRSKRACEGLIYISETDAPVVAFAGSAIDAVTAEVVLLQANLPNDAPIEERDFNEFFARLTADRDWHREIESARAKKFLVLQKLLEENLCELKVYKIGSRRLSVFVVGIDKGRRLMGVSTKAVET